MLNKKIRLNNFIVVILKSLLCEKKNDKNAHNNYALKIRQNPDKKKISEKKSAKCALLRA
jgi:hypothetical protein